MIYKTSLTKMKISHIPEVLVVDDEAYMREMMIRILDKDEYVIKASTDGISALNMAYKKEPDLVLLDIWLKGSDLDGLSVLERLKARYRYLPVIVITTEMHVKIAIKSLQLGAYDYIEKPFTEYRIKSLISKALESYKLKKENDELKALSQDYEIIGDSPIIKNLRNKINKAAANSSRVLIKGPSGSGKEIVARLIHKKSQTQNSPFIPLYLSRLSHNDSLSYIFGHEIDTNIFGEHAPKIGIIERSNGGTLFIDEISQINIQMQSRLLKLLQENIFYRENGTTPIAINTRIISSTSKDLISEINNTKFRQDLYNRLNILEICIPSIPDYSSDIPILCQYFINIISKKMGLLPCKISDEAIAVMQAYSWPGNLRQFKNTIEWILIMKSPDKHLITIKDLPVHITSNQPIENNINYKIISSPLKVARQNFEIQYLKAQLSRFSGNISKTAEFVGMERSALHRKLKTLGIC